MNRFEGLNLVDLLELLHEIVPPLPVSLMPQTVGWWILGGWALAVVCCVAAALIRHRRRNRYRRIAVSELRAISARQDDPRAAAELAALLKRTALAAYPRDRVASMYGRDWAAFLVQSVNGDRRVAEAADALAAAAYREDSNLPVIVPAAERWIRQHRV